MKQFTPLKKVKQDIFLDTDIGPDCDDVGAIAVLADYVQRLGATVRAIVNCTSNPYGTIAAKLLAEHRGLTGIQYGENKQKGILCGEETKRYNFRLAEKFAPEIRPGTFPDAVTVYRRVLTQCCNKGAIFITIGTYSTLAQLLQSQPDEIIPQSGIALFKQKVSAVVSMACKYPQGREFNIYGDTAAATVFFRLCPVPIFLSDYDVGNTIISGYDAPVRQTQQDPYWEAYQLYLTAGQTNCTKSLRRASFDLTAVQFAFEGEGEWFSLSQPETVVIGEDGTNCFLPDPDGNCRRIQKEKPDEAFAQFYNQILQNSDFLS